MLLTFAMMLTAPATCVDVKRECRACTVADGKQHCSTIGIACQPTRRICRPASGEAPADRPKAKERGR